MTDEFSATIDIKRRICDIKTDGRDMYLAIVEEASERSQMGSDSVVRLFEVGRQKLEDDVDDNVCASNDSLFHSIDIFRYLSYDNILRCCFSIQEQDEDDVDDDDEDASSSSTTDDLFNGLSLSFEFKIISLIIYYNS